MPEEAYECRIQCDFTVEIAQLPGAEDLETGQQVYLSISLDSHFLLR